jgi:hypothetical protein
MLHCYEMIKLTEKLYEIDPRTQSYKTIFGIIGDKIWCNHSLTAYDQDQFCISYAKSFIKLGSDVIIKTKLKTIK